MKVVIGKNGLYVASDKWDNSFITDGIEVWLGWNGWFKVISHFWNNQRNVNI